LLNEERYLLVGEYLNLKLEIKVLLGHQLFHIHCSRAGQLLGKKDFGLEHAQFTEIVEHLSGESLLKASCRLCRQITLLSAAHLEVTAALRLSLTSSTLCGI
jgi:hypothetical protein